MEACHTRSQQDAVAGRSRLGLALMQENSTGSIKPCRIARLLVPRSRECSNILRGEKGYVPHLVVPGLHDLLLLQHEAGNVLLMLPLRDRVHQAGQVVQLSLEGCNGVSRPFFLFWQDWDQGLHAARLAQVQGPTVLGLRNNCSAPGLMTSAEVSTGKSGTAGLEQQ